VTSRARVRAISTRLPHAERGAVEVVEAAQGGEEKEKKVSLAPFVSLRRSLVDHVAAIPLDSDQGRRAPSRVPSVCSGSLSPQTHSASEQTMPVSPLCDDTNGDIVLQTSDGFRSRVDSIRLGGASDVFRDLLRIDVGIFDEKTVDGLTLIKVSETSEGFGPPLLYAKSAAGSPTPVFGSCQEIRPASPPAYLAADAELLRLCTLSQTTRPDRQVPGHAGRHARRLVAARAHRGSCPDRLRPGRLERTLAALSLGYDLFLRSPSVFLDVEVEDDESAYRMYAARKRNGARRATRDRANCPESCLQNSASRPVQFSRRARQSIPRV
jgi:hypothetical protein